jgi:putative isomerase
MLDRTSELYEAALRAYIGANLRGVLKAPKACLKFPFIDPGSVYDGNLWDWDSFWAAYGAFAFLDHEAPAGEELRDLVIRHAEGNIRNFLDHQLKDGYIPMMVEVSDKVEPYLNARHREGRLMNMHKPFLCQQLTLVSGYKGDYSWASPFRPALERYFARYDADYLNANCGLYAWADDIMIGMDNDPASFGRPPFSTANMFLNGFMVSELRAMSLLLGKLGDAAASKAYEAKASALAGRIQAECWDGRDRFFYSADVDIRTRQYDWFHKGLGVFWKSLPIKIRAWTGFLPLAAGFASASQAESLVALHLRDPATFRSPFGIASLAMDEKMFNVEATNNPSNWLGPVWIVVNYVVFRGLMNYGYESEAESICRETLVLLGQDLERTGTIHEYYDPHTGYPVMNGGFINWNILALNMADELRGAPPMSAFCCSTPRFDIARDGGSQS